MKKTNVLLTSKLPRAELDYFKNNLGYEYNVINPSNFSEEEILKHITQSEILVGQYFTRKMLDHDNIKFLQVPQAGIEKLDIELLKQYNIPVCNSHSNALSVAEFAVGALLAIAKKIPYHDRLMRKGDWNSETIEDTGEELSTFSSYVYKKTIGFIGYGNIGKKIGQLLSGFNCRYMAIVNNKEKKYEELDFVGDVNDLDYVLENVDFLVVAAPLTSETEGMINMKNICKLKPTSYIVNISRGKIIEESSLYYVLKNNLIRGAALDPWYNYPEDNQKVTYPSVNYEFHKLNNIIMSPHRADLIYNQVPYLDDAIYNIKQYNGDKEYINILDMDKNY